MCDLEPCKKCREEIDEHAKMGFLLIVVRDEAEEGKPFWPWFLWYSVVKTEAAERMFHNFDLSKGRAVLPHSLAKKIGLPEPEMKP